MMVKDLWVEAFLFLLLLVAEGGENDKRLRLGRRQW